MTTRASRSSGGFTLLEVMLAILLLAVLLAGAYGAIRTAVHAMRSGEDAIDRTNRMRVAQEFIRHQISRALPLPFGQEQATGVSFVFQGERDFMRFVAPMPGYLSKGGPYVQTLEIAGSGRSGKQLLFTDMMLNGFDLTALKEDDSKPVVLLDQIEDGHFEYRALDEEGKLGDWSNDWDDPSLTPVMVRIHVKMLAQARTVWPEMDIPLMLDVGATRGRGNINRGMFPASPLQPTPGGNSAKASSQ